MSTTPQDISGLQGLLGNQTSTAPAPTSGGGVSSGELAGLQTLLSAKDSAPTMPTSRPSSGDEFDQAQQAGGYSEPAEKSGRPITYLIQKPDENYSDFMKRAVEHGKTVTPQDIEDEADQPGKMNSAAARGAEYGILGGATAGGALIAASGLDKIPGLTVQAYKWATANPVKAFFIYKAAEELGIGLNGVKKILHLASGVEK